MQYHIIDMRPSFWFRSAGACYSSIHQPDMLDVLCKEKSPACVAECIWLFYTKVDIISIISAAVIEDRIFLRVHIWPPGGSFPVFTFSSASCLFSYRLWWMLHTWCLPSRFSPNLPVCFTMSISGYLFFFLSCLFGGKRKTGTFIIPANGLENGAIHLQ